MANRIEYVKINGLFYPMVFSLGAKKQMSNIGNALSTIQKLKNSEQTEDKLELSGTSIDCITTIAEILIHQGCAYINKCEKNRKIRANSPVDKNGNYVSISKEDIETCIVDEEEMKELINKVISVMSSGKGTIKTISKSKNRPATQG